MSMRRTVCIDSIEPPAEIKDIIVQSDGVYLLCSGYDYFIPRSRIDSSDKLLGWACHLTEKTWMDMRRLRFFIEKVAREYELPIEKRI